MILTDVLLIILCFIKCICTDELSPTTMRNSCQQLAESTKQTTTMTSVDMHTTEKTDSGSLVSILFSSHALPIDLITFLFIFTEIEGEGSFL